MIQTPKLAISTGCSTRFVASVLTITKVIVDVRYWDTTSREESKGGQTLENSDESLKKDSDSNVFEPSKQVNVSLE
jgi:hypothetical protein